MSRFKLKDVLILKSMFIKTSVFEMQSSIKNSNSLEKFENHSLDCAVNE